MNIDNKKEKMKDQASIIGESAFLLIKDIEKGNIPEIAKRLTTISENTLSIKEALPSKDEAIQSHTERVHKDQMSKLHEYGKPVDNGTCYVCREYKERVLSINGPVCKECYN